MWVFQSTPSGGKATLAGIFFHVYMDVSIHAFRGEGDIGWINDSLIATWFQSTPSGGKATEQRALRTHDPAQFQSTPSGGKATVSAADSEHQQYPVSIHAFRGEGDITDGILLCQRSGFNPRLPGGRRRAGGWGVQRGTEFQSTPSGGKATARQSR